MQGGSFNLKSSMGSRLKLWVDGSNIDGQNNATLSNGQTISKWNDISGSGNHLNSLGSPIYRSAILNSNDIVEFTVDGMITSNQIDLDNIFIVHRSQERSGPKATFLFDFRNGNGSYIWSLAEEISGQSLKMVQ